MTNDETVKLRTMLSYWIEHNKEHGQEFREWAEKAKALGKLEVYEEILAAARELDKVNESLFRASSRLEKKGL